MAHFGLAIDAGTNDLFLKSNGELATVTGSEAVGQHVRQRLMTFHGEWFLDTEVGVKWLDEIMARQYDPAIAESVVKAEIMDTHGVTEITGFSVSFTRGVRRLNIKNIEVLTIYGEAVRV